MRDERNDAAVCGNMADRSVHHIMSRSWTLSKKHPSRKSTRSVWSERPCARLTNNLQLFENLSSTLLLRLLLPAMKLPISSCGARYDQAA